jgi:large subunit ribosomal protein L23
MIKPVFTEKSTRLAKEGKYTFLVDPRMDKSGLKVLISKLFNVHVKTIRTVKTGAEVKRNNKGMNVSKLATKKAIVSLKAGEKIDLFEEKKK